MARNSHTTDSKRYYDWLYYARLDYMVARLILKDKYCNSLTVFHCQQCIEKALKGYLLYKNRKLFDGHNLTWLCKQAIMTDRTFEQWLEKSSTLNRYYIESRYPADIPLEVDDETEVALLGATEEMLGFICDEIKFDFNSYHRRKQ